MAKATEVPAPVSLDSLARQDGFVVVLVPQKAFEVLEKHAQSKKISVSEVVAKAFGEYVQRNS
jgi:hypothetical protein